MAKFRIMTFDGGGIRGVITLTLLKRLEERFPGLSKQVDLFVGTSTGSYIALGLAREMTIEELLQIYSVENGRYIFTPKYLLFFRPKYNNKNLISLVKSYFPPALTLKDLKHKVVIPSFKVINCTNTCNIMNGSWCPIFFNNFSNSKYLNWPVADVALASSAAPIYFPSFKKHIDGGVIANNPSTAAISFALDKESGKQKIGNIRLLSIGTGFSPERITENTSRWGAMEWMLNYRITSPIFSILTDGVDEADAILSSQLLGKNYFRLNTLLEKSIQLDDYKKIPELVSMAEKTDLTAVNRWITGSWFD